MPIKRLSFENGVLEAVEDSVIPDGFASLLENWVPEPTGGLRCRRGWSSLTTTGAPTTRRIRGMGLYNRVANDVAITRVQFAQGTATTSPVAVSWPTATTANNLLLLVLTWQGATSAPTLTPPAGWTLAVKHTNVTGVAIYYKANASSESGSVSVTVSNSPRALDMALLEYSGIATSSPLDKTATNSGGGTVIHSGSTAVTTQASELCIAGLADTAAETMSSPSNSFSIVGQQSATSGDQMGTLEQIVSSIGAFNTSVLTSTSNPNFGAIATFKGVVTASAKQLLVAHNTLSAYTIYRIDRDAPTTWTSTDTVSVASTSHVSFAAGLLNILYVNQNFATIRRWDNSAAAAIAGSPAGRALNFHKGRFHAAGTTANPSRVWYSDLGSYATWGASSYFDVKLDDGDYVVDLCTFEDGELIAKENSLHYLSGSGPDDFDLHPLNAGSGYYGRCICPTSFGAVVAAKNQIWLVTGEAPDLISRPIEESYSAQGSFVTTAFIDNIVYVCDEATGTVYAWDPQANVWWVEKVASPTSEGPAHVLSEPYAGRFYYGPQAATTYSLATYRDHPKGSRARDESLAQTFRADTREMWLGMEDFEGNVAVTPQKLFLQIKQRGGDATETGITVTPVYDGTAETGNAIRTISPRASAGTYWEAVQLGSKKGIRSAKFQFEQTVAASQTSLMEIEQAFIGYDVTERNK